MKWLMNVNGDIWRQASDSPLRMIETESSEIPDYMQFSEAEEVSINFPAKKTINDIRKEMIETELENQQQSNTEAKGESE